MQHIRSNLIAGSVGVAVGVAFALTFTLTLSLPTPAWASAGREGDGAAGLICFKDPEILRQVKENVKGHDTARVDAFGHPGDAGKPAGTTVLDPKNIESIQILELAESRRNQEAPFIDLSSIGDADQIYQFLFDRITARARHVVYKKNGKSLAQLMSEADTSLRHPSEWDKAPTGLGRLHDEALPANPPGHCVPFQLARQDELGVHMDFRIYGHPLFSEADKALVRLHEVLIRVYRDLRRDPVNQEANEIPLASHVRYFIRRVLGENFERIVSRDFAKVLETFRFGIYSDWQVFHYNEEQQLFIQRIVEDHSQSPERDTFVLSGLGASDQVLLNGKWHTLQSVTSLDAEGRLRQARFQDIVWVEFAGEVDAVDGNREFEMDGPRAKCGQELILAADTQRVLGLSGRIGFAKGTEIYLNQDCTKVIGGTLAGPTRLETPAGVGYFSGPVALDEDTGQLADARTAGLQAFPAQGKDFYFEGPMTFFPEGGVKCGRLAYPQPVRVQAYRQNIDTHLPLHEKACWDRQGLLVTGFTYPGYLRDPRQNMEVLAPNTPIHIEDGMLKIAFISPDFRTPDGALLLVEPRLGWKLNLAHGHWALPASGESDLWRILLPGRPKAKEVRIRSIDNRHGFQFEDGLTLRDYFKRDWKFGHAQLLPGGKLLFVAFLYKSPTAMSELWMAEPVSETEDTVDYRAYPITNENKGKLREGRTLIRPRMLKDETARVVFLSDRDNNRHGKGHNLFENMDKEIEPENAIGGLLTAPLMGWGISEWLSERGGVFHKYGYTPKDEYNLYILDLKSPRQDPKRIAHDGWTQMVEYSIEEDGTLILARFKKTGTGARDWPANSAKPNEFGDAKFDRVLFKIAKDGTRDYKNAERRQISCSEVPPHLRLKKPMDIIIPYGTGRWCGTPLDNGRER